MFKAVGAFLQDELGAEEPDDLKHLNAEHLEAIRAKLKPLQVPKFERKLVALMGGALPVAGGAAGGAAGAEPEPEPCNGKASGVDCSTVHSVILSVINILNHRKPSLRFSIK